MAAKIGIGQTYSNGGVQDFDWTIAISAALNDGHRELIFTDSNYDMKTGVDLGSYGPGIIIIMNGGGPSRNHLRRFPQLASPIFFSSNVALTLEFTGMGFNGIGSTDPALPLCSFFGFSRVKFTNCIWTASRGYGLSLSDVGGGSGSGTVEMVDCRFTDNENGLLLDRVGSIFILGAVVERNGDHSVPSIQGLGYGIRIIGDGTALRSFGTLRIHGELSGAGGNWCVYLENVRSLSLVDSLLVLNNPLKS